MTKDEYNEAAALVVRLRKELEHTNQHLVAHIDALTKSNAQCGEYLRRNEQLHSELVEVRAALASVTEQRDSYKRTLDEWERADTKPHTRIDEVAQVVPVCMQCLKDRIETAHAYETGPSVAILTKPLLPDDVADHVVPPVLHVGEPDPVNDPKDAALEFRNVVPTPEMLRHVGYWDLVSGAAAIAFKPGGLRLVFWRISGSQEWRTDPCPQPLKPHGMTWQQLDKLQVKAPHNVADHVVPPVLPMCNVCHGCGMPLGASANRPYLWCTNFSCNRETTQYRDHDASPYWGPCKSTTPVRHE